MRKEVIQIIYKLSTKCNQNCFYCFDSTNRDSNKINYEEHLEFFKKLFCEFYNVNIILHGGEITLIDVDELDSFLAELVVLAQKQSTTLNFSIQTNGVLFDESFRNLCKKYTIQTGVSYDFTEESRHYILSNDKLRYFNTCIVVLNKYNLNKLEYIYNEANKLRLNLKFNFPFSTNKLSCEDILGCTLDDAIDTYLKFLDIYFYDKHGTINLFFANDLIKLSLGKKQLVDSCLLNDCNDIISIDNKGNIRKCDNCSYNDLIIGDINTYDSFDSLKHLNNTVNDKCKNCKLDLVCPHNCFNRVLVGDNDFICKLIKKAIPYLYDKFNDLSIEELASLNPVIVRLLIESHYVPSSIKGSI